MKSWILPKPKACRFRWSLQRQLVERTVRLSPEFFRRSLRLPTNGAGCFEQQMQPWQRQDFEVLDPAWQALAGRPVTPPFRRAWIERPRGHSKTCDMAVQIAWILLAAPHAVHGLAAAADREQAGLIHDAVARLARLNADLCRPLAFRQHLVVNTETGSRLEVISSDVQSSWGALPDFVICDELCHWTEPEFWYSLLSSSAKRPQCVLVVLTNAGIGRGWHWELREAARTSPEWYFSSLVGAQAPWITPESLAEQQRLLPQPVFDRLWQNVWQHSDGTFVTLAEAEACRDMYLQPQTRGRPGRRYFAAVDYAEKHDYTAAIVVHWEGPRLVVDRLDVVAPHADAPVPIAWVEEWIEHIALAFRPVRFVLDEYQLLGTIQRLEARHDLRRFEFLSGRGNHALATSLRRMIVERQLAWYPGCGQLDRPERDDLETELASLVLRQTSGGRCRIDHPRDGRHHDDRAFVLGAACLEAVTATTSPDWLDIQLPDRHGDFAW